jgi:hypothetical protein
LSSSSSPSSSPDPNLWSWQTRWFFFS